MKTNKTDVVERRLVRACGCKYQREKDWGYDLQKRIPAPHHWEGIGWGSLETVNKVLLGRDFKALVRCRGCNTEMLRDH